MLNKSIENIPLPSRMQSLPVDARGYPVPWFVGKVNGEWDFRSADGGKLARAVHEKRCWLCGQKLGVYLTFVIGPMCSVNRVSSEPPSHRECAEYAVRACPFLSQPRMRRNEKGLPEQRIDPAGLHIEHNPGASLIWVTKEYQPFNAMGGVLFHLGDPLEVHWYAEGRPATRDEVLAAMAKGLPKLRELAAVEGREAEEALQTLIDRAATLVPKQDILERAIEMKLIK